MTFAEAQADAAARAGDAPAGRKKNPKRVASGRASRKRGARPEDALKVLHARYHAEGRALLRKLETPIRRISTSGPGRFVAVYLARAHVDFSGWVRLGGGHSRPVDLEVKTTEEPRIALAEVDEEQGAELAATAAAGGLACVLVRVQGAWWLVPWSRWRAPVTEPGRKSLTAEHLDACGVRVALRGAAPDWLPALLQVLP
jgi:penicillin-binding protein-related factor A (putative recombinase)